MTDCGRRRDGLLATMMIRDEQLEDAALIRDVITEAFAVAEHSGAGRVPSSI